MKRAGYFIFGVLTALLVAAGCSKTPEKAVVSVTGPEGMEITVGDVPVGRAPVTLKLNAGTYLFKFHAPGYERRWETVVLRQAEKRAMPVRLERETASVLITTKPVGAQLIVDGRVLGATPIVLEKVLPGKEYVGSCACRVTASAK